MDGGRRIKREGEGERGGKRGRGIDLHVRHPIDIIQRVIRSV